MITMLDIAPAQYTAIMELVKAGKYPSPEVFLELALKNQLLLEQHSHGVRPQVGRIQPDRTAAYSLGLLGKSFNEEPMTVPAVQLLESRRATPIWGLINRFAPSKLVVRLLSNSLITAKSQWIDFKQFEEEVVGIAGQVRVLIEKHEKRLDTVRGESLKIGFPQKDPKSQQRFVDFYVGRLRGEDVINGLLGDLEFAVIRRTQATGPSSLSIGLTESGMKWASLRSPLIDDFVLGQQPAHRPLSDEEVSFLVSHIQTMRPGEFEFLSFLYSLIRDGFDTPQKISEKVSKYFAGRRYTPTLINTMQTGGLARLVEMRLVRIEKKSIYTTYRASSYTDLNQVAGGTSLEQGYVPVERSKEVTFELCEKCGLAHGEKGCDAGLEN